MIAYNMLYNQPYAEEKLPLNLRWEKRKPRLLEYIFFAKPDIIKSQELQDDQVNEVMENWAPFYKDVYTR